MSNEHDSWLERIGVTWFKSHPDAPPDNAPGTNLTNADFPTDIAQRNKADEEARKRGRELAGAQPTPGGDPSPDSKEESFVKKGIDKLREKLGEKLPATPAFSTEKEQKAREDAEPLVHFFNDMQSGTEMYAKYVNYIKKQLDRAAKYGDLAGATRIAEAAQGMSKIAGRLQSGLSKAGDVCNKARKMAAWIEAARQFADSSANMKCGNPQSVEDWIGSLKDLWDATLPFKKELEDKWWEAALEGSEAAAVAAPAMATLSIVGAQLYVAINLLDQGVKNERAYFDRLKRETQTDEERAAAAAADPGPDFPGQWESAEEQEQREKRQRDYEHYMTERNARDSAVLQATQKFEAEVFPKIYARRRSEIRQQILAAVQKTGGSPATDWSECLMPSGEEHYDDKLGIEIYGTKEKVNADEITTEIGNFQGVKPPCPFFQKIHDEELKIFLARSVKSAR
jgi:hypothetical protein